MVMPFLVCLCVFICVPLPGSHRKGCQSSSMFVCVCACAIDTHKYTHTQAPLYTQPDGRMDGSASTPTYTRFMSSTDVSHHPLLLSHPFLKCSAVTRLFFYPTLRIINICVCVFGKSGEMIQQVHICTCIPPTSAMSAGSYISHEVLPPTLTSNLATYDRFSI